MKVLKALSHKQEGVYILCIENRLKGVLTSLHYKLW